MKALRILLLLLITLPAFSQDETADDEIRQNQNAVEKIKAAQAAYITERLGLTSAEAEKFWPIYHEFSEKRQTLRQQFRQSRRSGKNEKEVLDLELKLKQDQLDLEKDYADKFQKVIPAQKVVQLRQAEADFRKLLLRQLRDRQNKAERIQRQRDRSEPKLQPRKN